MCVDTFGNGVCDLNEMQHIWNDTRLKISSAPHVNSPPAMIMSEIPRNLLHESESVAF